MTDTSPPSWQASLSHETSRAFAAFCAYRDAGPTRSLVETYRQETGRKQARQTSGEWNAWAEKNDWPERAAAYDLHLAEKARATAEADHAAKITAYRERAAKIGAATADVSLGFLVAAGKRLKSLDVNDIPITSLASLLTAASRVAEVSLKVEAEALGVRELETYLHDGDQDAAKDPK